ncbi:MAG: DUF72 domain-containing protein, partial [Limisphaerales bacterium]
GLRERMKSGAGFTLGVANWAAPECLSRDAFNRGLMFAPLENAVRACRLPDMELAIGTSGFQYPEWRGTFYPEKMAANRMLSFYSHHFVTTEINYSFRRIPSLKTIREWADSTPPGFRFSFKAPQKVTHFARLRDCRDTMEYFATVLSDLGEKLGAVLFQLPPDFQKDRERLATFLVELPRKIRPAFEFRHPSWFEEDVLTLLKENNAALCLADSEKLRTPRVTTADFGYLRLRREDYQQQDIEGWAEVLQSHEGIWNEAYVYFKHEESGVGPKFANQLKDATSTSVSR